MKKSVLNLVLFCTLAEQAGISADLKLDNGQLSASDLAIRPQLAQRLEEISAPPRTLRGCRLSRPAAGEPVQGLRW
jgi:hypothetical protein